MTKPAYRHVIFDITLAVPQTLAYLDPA